MSNARAVLATLVAVSQNAPVQPAAPSPLDRFKALKGAWDADIDADGKPGHTADFRLTRRK
jgi:hypothetical protein